ncbi:uncharacterized protein LOC111354693 [Spodoptera litura]|uniref:Uncharacterized protein LOC111354693 n=1 Tax=Spodoptera litura TaxID=69820 RepID=A0A9J7E453_SPOLT|nr:uncharacterized protein LOC111354693 [Spodoptera litura]
MANLQRTPPKTARTPTKNLTQTVSESDINSAVMMSDFVNTRSKRPRHEDSPQDATEIGTEALHRVIAQQTEMMSKLVSDVREIKCQNAQIQSTNAAICKSNDDIVKSMDFMNIKFEELKKEIETLRKEKQEQRQYIEKLEKKIQDIQHKSRPSGIEIRNIPLSENEKSADLVKAVCDIGEAVGLHISESELRDIYRLPGKSSNGSDNPRPIIAEFNSVQKKQTLLTAVRTYNNDKGKENKLNTAAIGLAGTRQPVYIVEHIPPNTKILFYRAREFAKANDFKYCWISNGNIFLRKSEGDKRQIINSEKCLNYINK